MSMGMRNTKNFFPCDGRFGDALAASWRGQQGDLQADVALNPIDKRPRLCSS